MKRKKWHYILIFAVTLLTLFNVLPTVIYYAKPLDRPIGSAGALEIAKSAAQRIKQTRADSLEFAKAALRLADVKPTEIKSDLPKGDIEVHFKEKADAWKFAATLQRASGAHPFAPVRPVISGVDEKDKVTTVRLSRPVCQHLDIQKLRRYFGFAPLKEGNRWSEGTCQVANDRLAAFARSIGSSSESSIALQVAAQNDEVQPVCLDIARRLIDFVDAYGISSGPAKRYFASFSNGMSQGASKLLKESFEKQRTIISQRIERLNRKKPDGYKGRIEALEAKRSVLGKALAIVLRRSDAFDAGHSPLSKGEILRTLDEQKDSPRRLFSLGARDPFVAAVALDENLGSIELVLHQDLGEAKDQGRIRAHVAALAARSTEEIQFAKGRFYAPLHQLNKTASLLTLDASSLMDDLAKDIACDLKGRFSPKSDELKGFDVITYSAFKELKDPKAFKGFVVCNPVAYDDELPMSFERSSLYIFARGLESSLKKPSDELKQDLATLRRILYSGAFGYDYPSSYLPLPDLFHGDYFFEIKQPLDALLKATREPWRLLGSKRVAVLELADHRQRIDALNAIEDAEHKELLQWRDDYRSASVDLNPERKLSVPPPARSTFWSNFKLSLRKYFRGNPARVLKWGLDLSGGKTIHIQLLDRTGALVTDPDDLATATSELYLRANRLGLSDVAVRSEGDYIVMDFPGSQNLSARDLVTGSSMTFHVVNESFSAHHPENGPIVQQFLTAVGSEALMREGESLDAIAYDLLEKTRGQEGSAGHYLWARGLRLTPPNAAPAGDFDTTHSRIAPVRTESGRGELMILFANFALEGASLSNVYAGYDPEQGNKLSFQVVSERSVHGLGKVRPQEQLAAWTGHFAETKERPGYRMAALLNGEVISAPVLKAPIETGGEISGSFTLREVKKLESDLRAGSLSFTPKILSESNISPELGLSERSRAIVAMGLSLLAVMVIMIAVYRFGGVVASACVLFNLLVMWAIFQSLGAALSLATIAGSILTIGMAVDANVLVFERIREEFTKSGNIKYALVQGYKRAFSAIFDSNLTTAVAALILLNFDSGPIKGFALTIVIGIISSMFTALFVSRFFFSIWVENPRNTTLSMRHLFKGVRLDFFRGSKIYAFVVIAILGIGLLSFSTQKKQLLGMDFTGGFAFKLELATGSKQQVESALLKAGLSSHDARLRELSSAKELKVMLAPKLRQMGEDKSPSERINWIFSQLRENQIVLAPSAFQTAEQTWVEMSSELSDAMTSQALIGLALALVFILAYISWRFEATGAFAAIVCLIHDVLITLACISLMRYFGLDLQIDLHTIAALMTIVGYSLNDTIIIFDRVREQRTLNIAGGLREQLNMALGHTLSRTLMTSLTTLVVLLFLVGSGGGVIFGFACVMTIGVFFGTLSSLLLAGPLWSWLASRQRPERSLA